MWAYPPFKPGDVLSVLLNPVEQLCLAGGRVGKLKLRLLATESEQAQLVGSQIHTASGSRLTGVAIGAVDIGIDKGQGIGGDDKPHLGHGMGQLLLLLWADPDASLGQ